jgi:hypothetical protein
MTDVQGAAVPPAYSSGRRSSDPTVEQGYRGFDARYRALGCCSLPWPEVP